MGGVRADDPGCSAVIAFSFAIMAFLLLATVAPIVVGLDLCRAKDRETALKRFGASVVGGMVGAGLTLLTLGKNPEDLTLSDMAIIYCGMGMGALVGLSARVAVESNQSAVLEWGVRSNPIYNTGSSSDGSRDKKEPAPH